MFKSKNYSNLKKIQIPNPKLFKLEKYSDFKTIQTLKSSDLKIVHIQIQKLFKLEKGSN
jgi:hypothetical protein